MTIQKYLLNEEMKLMAFYYFLTFRYRKNICNKCIGTEKQICRNCSLLRGLNKPTCKTMTKNIDKKIKNKNRLLMQKIIYSTIYSNVGIED